MTRGKKETIKTETAEVIDKPEVIETKPEIVTPAPASSPCNGCRWEKDKGQRFCGSCINYK